MEKFFSDLFRNHGKLPALFELVRPWNAVVSGFVALFGSLVVNEFSLLNNVILFFTFTVAYMGGTTINDLVDEFADKINMPFRPIPANRLDKREVLLSSFLLHFLALVLAFYLGFYVVILLILFFVFSFMYSAPPIRFSKRGVLSQIELSITVVAIPMYTGMVFGSGNLILDFTSILLIILFSIFFIFVFLLKDFKDIKGDIADNKNTVVLQLGKKKTQILSLFGSTSSLVVLIIVSYEIFQSTMYHLISLSIVLIGFFLIEKEITSNPEKNFALARLLFLIVILIFIGGVLGVF